MTPNLLRSQYLRLLKQYLSWCATRYTPRARQNSVSRANIEIVFADVADVIERRFESPIINARPDRDRYRTLTDNSVVWHTCPTGTQFRRTFASHAVVLKRLRAIHLKSS